MAKIRFKKLRLWMVYPLFIIYPFVARLSDVSLGAGSLLIVAGALVRLGAAGYLIKAHHLTTCGPYAFTRNPLYAGSFLVGLGVVVMSSNVFLALYYIASFYVLYAGTIREEEKGLRLKYGAAFDDYAASVPPFLPTLFVYPRREKRPFSWSHVFRNGEFIRLCGFGVLLAFLHLWHVVVAPHRWSDSHSIASASVFLVFLALLWLNIFIRRKAEKAGGSSRGRLRKVLRGKGIQ